MTTDDQIYEVLVTAAARCFVSEALRDHAASTIHAAADQGLIRIYGDVRSDDGYADARWATTHATVAQQRYDLSLELTDTGRAQLRSGS